MDGAFSGLRGVGLALFLMGLDYYFADKVVPVLGDLGDSGGGPIQAVGKALFLEEHYVPYLGVSLWIVPFLLVRSNPVEVVSPISGKLVGESFYSLPAIGAICEYIFLGEVSGANVLFCAGVVPLGNEVVGCDGLGLVWRFWGVV